MEKGKYTFLTLIEISGHIISLHMSKIIERVFMKDRDELLLFRVKLDTNNLTLNNLLF